MLDPASAPESTTSEPPRILMIQRLAAVFEVLLASGLFTQLFLIGILSGTGMRMRTPEGLLSPRFIFTLSLLDTTLLIGLIVFFFRAHGESGAAVLFGRRPIVREALLGIVLTPAIFMLVVIVLAIILVFAPSLHNVPRNPLQDLLTNRADAAVFALVAMIAGGVREEVQRGFILHRFDQYLGGAGVGIAVFSVVFGLGHIDQGFDAAIATATLGATWGLIYVFRRSIVAPMISHAGFNLAQVVKYSIGGA